MTYDLAIVGGGPAGCSAAITAAGLGLRVVLCERGSYDRPEGRDRVCGEFVSAEALPLLERWLPELTTAAPRIVRTRFITGSGKQGGFALAEEARGIARRQMDVALWRAAEAAGAVLHARTAVAQVRRHAGGSEIRTATGEVLAARHVIWAAGRQPARRGGGWVGVKAHFGGLEQRPEVELYAFGGGYCGLAPVAGGLCNVCCLLQRSPGLDLQGHQDMAGWLAQRAGSGRLRERLRGAQQRHATVVAAGIALGPGAAADGDGNLRAGDASGFLDPFTGGGIARALLSGEMAALAVGAGKTDTYAGALRRASARSFRAGAWVRAAVMAPDWMQTVLLPLLAHPRVGGRLAAATRWRNL